MSSQLSGPPDQGAKPQPRIAPTSPSRTSESTPSSSARTASSACAIISRFCTSCSEGWGSASGQISPRPGQRPSRLPFSS